MSLLDDPERRWIFIVILVVSLSSAFVVFMCCLKQLYVLCCNKREKEHRRAVAIKSMVIYARQAFEAQAQHEEEYSTDTSTNNSSTKSTSHTSVDNISPSNAYDIHSSSLVVVDYNNTNNGISQSEDSSEDHCHKNHRDHRFGDHGDDLTLTGSEITVIIKDI